MRIIAAPQEFKGTLSAEEAAAAMAAGARRALPDDTIEAIPLADGGPGTVHALVAAAVGEVRPTSAQDPLGRPIAAEWGMLPDGTAVIEMAAASGLVLLRDDERDARRTTTYGTGELIRDALDAGSRHLIIGSGGSATNDGGAGMAAALGVRFFDADGRDLAPGGAALAHLARIVMSDLDPRIGESSVVVATDVQNPLCGAEGASLVYGPQKGASPDVARQLDAALQHYAHIVERDTGVRVIDRPGAGSAGGLAAGLIAFCRAEVRPGFDVVADVLQLRERLRGADLVITGEGRLDGQTSFGKTVAGLARLAGEEHVPVLVVPGALGPGWEKILPLVAGVEPVVGGAATQDEALARPAEMLALTVERALHGWQRMEELR